MSRCDAELTSYHPEARRIMSAYVAGVNASIAQATRSGKLPMMKAAIN